MWRFSLLLCALFFSCATAPDPKPYLDSPLSKYVERFEREAGIVVDYPVVLTDIPKVVGLCTSATRAEKPYKSVFIDRVEWNKLQEYQREILVYHELAHCSLGRDHSLEKFENGEPKSIMFPSLELSKDWYKTHRTYYINEVRE